MMNNAIWVAVLEQSRNWLYAIAVFVVLIIALFVYQTQFVEAETGELQTKLSNLQQQVRNREAKLAESGVPISAVEQMEKDLQTFAELIPPKQKFANFIGELYHLANQAELEIRQISYQPKVNKENQHLEYGLSFSLDGEYGQLKKFVYLLENSKRILVVDKIGLSGKPSKDSSAGVNLQIALTTFFQEDAQ